MSKTYSVRVEPAGDALTFFGEFLGLIQDERDSVMAVVRPDENYGMYLQLHDPSRVYMIKPFPTLDHDHRFHPEG